MADMRLIKGKTLTKQMQHVDTILTRFQRRLHKKVYAMPNQVPVAAYKEVIKDNESILHYMFPAKGTINVVVFSLDSMPKSGIEITAKIVNADKVPDESKTFFTKKKTVVVEPGLSVSIGTKLSIYVKKINEDEQMSGAWISLIWIPEVPESLLKEHLIDALDKEEENAGESEED